MFNLPCALISGAREFSFCPLRLAFSAIVALSPSRRSFVVALTHNSGNFFFPLIPLALAFVDLRLGFGVFGLHVAFVAVFMFVRMRKIGETGSLRLYCLMVLMDTCGLQQVCGF
ncbi:unnamed protein product [Ceratitis capitata]|uniref:(Mediterranean fruit fly) hypothetical protein n=1 Tax=Ceratitis capitata TaxID=7213 RepID=A0A811URZ0_CERCA|nr:unnamed protein product [Ceratitis capitata]